MSRIWKLPVSLPEWVTAELNGSEIKVTWPKWNLSYVFPSEVDVELSDSAINFSISSDENKNLWWLVRSIVNNMVEWVNNWFEKSLLVIWVWYSAKVEWNTVVLNLWYSHPINFKLPEWVTAAVDKDSKWNIILKVMWIDKQVVWQVAANIRELRMPEPYKWKWIRYQWEHVKMKVWKTAKK